MDKIIGIGRAGCNIVDKFNQYSQYECYKIDTNPNVLENQKVFKLKTCRTPEEYESSVPDLSDFFKDLDGDVLFVLAGGGKITGITLKVLQQIKHCNINVLYVVPDQKAITNTAYLQNRLTFYVLQEYARSGLLNKIYLASNSVLEKIVGDVPLLQLNNNMNDLLVNAIHYLNIFSNTEPVLNNIETPNEISRIATFGVYDIKNSTEMQYFPLDTVKDKCYYYCINEDVINSDGRLFKNIKEQLSKESIRVSYQIHSTKHSESFCYTVGYTNQIQALDKAE
jgi:hypothetical protein